MKNIRIPFHLPAIIALLIFMISCQKASYERIPDGLIVHVEKTAHQPAHAVRLQVIRDHIIHVTSVPGEVFSEPKSLIVPDTLSATADFDILEQDDKIILKTKALQVQVRPVTGEVSFSDARGQVYLAEKQGGGKSFGNVMVDGQKFLTVQQQFGSADGEALYGLGSNQTSYMNLKGKDADLFQYNTQAIVPFLVSTRNYGILWDNYSRTRFGDVREPEELSGLKLYDKDGREGGLSAIYRDRNDTSKVFLTRMEREINYQFIPDLVKFPEGYNLGEAAVTWIGAMEAAESGTHKFIFTSAGYARLWVDGTLLFDRWRQCWNTCSNRFDLNMEAGKKYALKIEWIPDGGESFITLKHLSPLPADDQNRITLASEVADQIDYYFIAGQSMDEVISGYRTLTGKATMMPKWALGFWQSRERYKTQQEILEVVSEYRKRNIPLDNIVLDWQYWPIDKWGDHQFEASRFPDPAGMMTTLHDSLNARLMISVWPKYYKGTANFEAMDQKGWLYKLNIEKNRKDWLGYVSTFYDAYNTEAQKAFWDQINAAIYSKGVDAWWLDATEPDICSNLPMDERKALMNPTALGPAAKYFNAFALEQAQAVYEGQRRTNPGKRVYILTRSAFAGLQRYAAANWSGDIAARWHDMAAQIPCGLNFSISGIPWWTMDIGGFAVENRYYDATGETLEEWRELMTRWHQFGAFVPIFRSHGQYPYREIYLTAPQDHPVYQAMVDYNHLRYRLMPYIYSLAGYTWLNDYTVMRPLAMDFGEDARVLDIGDQYMFGPDLMINPVCTYRARERAVYLPAPTGWYDFFTGGHYPGGQTIMAPSPLEYIPTFVREGTILPLGPEIQHTAEKPADPLTLFVFSGHDGKFVLYEDENTNYNYEKGAFTTISFLYDDSGKTLTIGQREGTFEGMLQRRTIQIIVVTPLKPEKMDLRGVPDKVITYDGTGQIIDLSNL
ncbi:MAG TPA: glycoside hydrolase family 31 protein [Bacteroidales bacterium]|nr:glycoside hydrolase family 31 protein [Bacteroidales bacterium]